ncbi:MAG: hypothetical protein R3B49_00400 [Phycisphaerales bacterium]
MKTRVMAALAALLIPAASVLAQSEDLRPPMPQDLKGTPTIMTLLATVIIVALVVFAAAFPTKRGHQD